MIRKECGSGFYWRKTTLNNNNSKWNRNFRFHQFRIGQYIYFIFFQSYCSRRGTWCKCGKLNIYLLFETMHKTENSNSIGSTIRNEQANYRARNSFAWTQAYSAHLTYIPCHTVVFAHVMAVYVVVDWLPHRALPFHMASLWQEVIFACKFFPRYYVRRFRFSAPFDNCENRKHRSFRQLTKRNCRSTCVCVCECRMWVSVCLCAVGCVTKLNCLWQIISSAKCPDVLTYSRNCSAFTHTNTHTSCIRVWRTNKSQTHLFSWIK